MTDLISIVTPVHAPAAPYLREAYESLRAQELPDGWEWEWIVQEDGDSGAVAELIPDDPRISYGFGRQQGPSVARTVALSRCQGALVQALDADDRLTPGALARAITALTERPEVGWTTAAALDLLPDGSTVGWPDGDPPEGAKPNGWVFDYWLNHNYRLPVVPGTLCIRRSLVLALGGWMALPASEDTGLLIAASVVRPGYFIATPGLLYRKWPGQSTAQLAHLDEGELRARVAVIEARARALQEGEWISRFPG
jgi:glycosyltransferase involved in cell wall biosynthesis